MKRHRLEPRTDWQDRVTTVGLSYHSHDQGPYWDEAACYELEQREVLELEAATKTLHTLCIEAAEQVIERDWWDRLKIPLEARPLILRSWEQDDFSLYGRFDLAYDGISPPKLLEYNADTPTSLIEASVVQWFWLQETHPGMDQFNSIHERLIEAWKRQGTESVHFAHVRECEEDAMTVRYLRDTCVQAGRTTGELAVDEIGWHSRDHRFVDLQGLPIEACFKLYPWEWMASEEFAAHLRDSRTRFLEPAWKMLLSNKGILPVLWELFPEHPNLLPAHDTPTGLGEDYVRKPLLGREGANVSLFKGARELVRTDGDYEDTGFICQKTAPIPCIDGMYPVFGTWIIDHEPAGLGIREDSAMITGNLSRFVPHFFRPS